MGSIPIRRSLKGFADSSVLFAAADSPTGVARTLMQAAEQNTVTLFLHHYVLAETRRNLDRKSPKGLPVVENT
jgi:hypothetical protein